MRRALLGLLLVAACGGNREADLAVGGDDGANADGSFPTEPAPSNCRVDDDCRPAAATCCECPSFAVAASDPIYTACSEVMCPADPTCPLAVHAVCHEGTCALACQPLACPTTGANGYQLDANGCLTCDPNGIADPAFNACDSDDDCVETRADCCGCAQGGADTAVLASELGTFDDALDCSADEACPSVSTCEAGAAPECVVGTCKLLVGEPPANACGRAGLAPCAAGQVCTVNLDEDATDRGLGICAPAP